MLRRLLGVCLICFGHVSAKEHSACFDLALSEPGYTRIELVAIAHSCTSPMVADLYYNRAQYLRLLNKYSHFEQSLHHYNTRDHLAYIESYRIHIALAEAFSSQDLSTDKQFQTLARLNRIYELSSEIAELRFKGYDLLADRLEQKYQL
jgi:hypothetical protein